MQGAESTNPKGKIPLVSLVVVNYNGHTRLKELLDQCLTTLLDTDYPSFEVIFVDNGSEDDSASYVSNRYTDPRLRVLRSDVNSYYTGGANMGAGAAKGDLIGVLNNDIVFNRAWLRPLVEFLLDNPNAGLVSPRLLYDEGTYDSLGVETNLMMVAWDKFSRSPVARYTPKEPFKVAAPPGAAFLLPRKIIARLNGELLDTGFGAYHEEVDLGLRLGLMGYDSFMVPASSVIHKRGSTYGLMTPVKLYLIRRNAVRTGVKLLGPRSIPFLPVWFAASLYASYIYYASTGDSGYLLVPFRAASSTLLSFRAIWSKHISFEQRRRKPLQDLPLSDSLVINADRVGTVGRVGVTFFNMIAALVGLGKFKITTNKKYPLWGLSN